MAQVGKDTLKGYFQRGDRPNEEQFIDLIDSMYSKEDDHVFTASTIVSTGNTKILECTEQGGKIGTLYVDKLFVGGQEYETGGTVVEMYGYKYDPEKESFAELTNDINIATGDYSHAEGWGSSATTDYSHSEGLRSKTSGSAAHSEGADTLASGQSSHAEGNQTTAMTQYAHAEGDKTLANGTASHSEGVLTRSTGHGAHAEGGNTTASTEYAHAEGYGNLATGQAAHAEGRDNVASGMCSHASGFMSKALYPTSFVHGIGVTGSSQVSGSTHLGRYGRISDREQTTGKYMIFSVSNGTTTSPKNTFEILMGGLGTTGFFSLNEGQIFSGVTTAVTSSSTNEQLPTAKACWNAITGNAMTQATADNKYLTKQYKSGSVTNTAITASWNSAYGLAVSAPSSDATHGLVVQNNGEMVRLNAGSVTTTKNVNARGDLNVTGNTVIKGGTSANTLTTTGNTKLASTTANTLVVTGTTNLNTTTAYTLNVKSTAVISGSTTLKGTLTSEQNNYLKATTTSNNLIVTGNTTLSGGISLSGVGKMYIYDAISQPKVIELYTPNENQYISCGGKSFIKVTGEGSFHNSDPNIHILYDSYVKAGDILFVQNATNKTFDFITGTNGGTSRIGLFSVPKGQIGMVVVDSGYCTIDNNKCCILKRIVT